MDRSKAERIVLQKHNSKKLLGRLLIWNEALALKENAANLGVSYFTALQIALSCGIKYLKTPRGRKNVDYSHLIKKWDSEKSMEENAKKLGVNIFHARLLRQKFGLAYTSTTKTGKVRTHSRIEESEQLKKMKTLRLAGMTFQTIGNIYGITKQRVAQLCE